MSLLPCLTSRHRFLYNSPFLPSFLPLCSSSCSSAMNIPRLALLATGDCCCCLLLLLLLPHGFKNFLLNDKQRRRRCRGHPQQQQQPTRGGGKIKDRFNDKRGRILAVETKTIDDKEENNSACLKTRLAFDVLSFDPMNLEGAAARCAANLRRRRRLEISAVENFNQGLKSFVPLFLLLPFHSQPISTEKTKVSWRGFGVNSAAAAAAALTFLP
jgi:hypothetical protein